MTYRLTIKKNNDGPPGSTIFLYSNIE